MSTQGDVLKLEVDDTRDAAVIQAGFLPGWVGEGGLRSEPLQDFQSHCWRWKKAKHFSRKPQPISTRQNRNAETFAWPNPAPGKRTSLSTLHCSYQMVGPGQFARAHRHTVNAGRFILESDGAYTTLNGEKVFMDENDLIPHPTGFGMVSATSRKAIA